MNILGSEKNLTDSKMQNETNQLNGEFLDYGDIVLKEFIDKNRLLWLLKHLDKDDKNLSKLKNIKKGLIFDDKKKCWFHNVNYSKDQHGRLYAKGSNLQNIGSKIRNTLIYNMCLDIDIKNASFSLLLEDAKQKNVSLKYVEEYYNNRDEKLNEVMDFYNVERSIAKELFIFCISCVEKNTKTKKYDLVKSWKLLNKLNKSNSKIENFIDNLFNEICNYANTIEKPNNLIFINYIYDLEIKVLLNIKNILPEFKTTFNCLIHDGGLILKNELTNDNMINHINDKLKEQYSFIEICFKPFEHYYEINETNEDNNTDFINSIDILIRDIIFNCNTESVAELFKKRYNSFIKSSGNKKERAFFIYENHRWILDKSGDVYIRKYIKLINDDLKDIQKELINLLKNDNENEQLVLFKKALDKSIKNLGSNTFIKQCIEHVSAEIYEDDFFDKLDNNKFLLGFNNGIYDLKNGVFRDGKPDDMVHQTVGYDFEEPEKDDYELLKKLMQQILFVEDERTHYFKYLSTMLYGAYIQGFGVAIGEGGNGKSLIISLLCATLGEYVARVSSNVLTKDVCGDVANPELSKCNKKRGVICEEADRNLKLKINTINALTGCGTFQARSLFSNNTDMDNQMTLMMASNVLPQFNTEPDSSMERRFNIFEFKSKYTTIESQINEDNHIYKANPEYVSKEWITKMRCSFMKYLLEHFQLFQKDEYNLIRPECIIKNNNHYFMEGTDIDRILSEYIELDENEKGFITLKSVWDKFEHQLVKANCKRKKDLFNIIRKHPVYGKYYKEHNRNGSNLLLNYRFVKDEDDNNEIDED